MDDTPKYKSLKELKEAFDSDELDREAFLITLDNDSCTMYMGDTCFFRCDGGGDVLVEEALDLLGIPWQNA